MPSAGGAGDGSRVPPPFQSLYIEPTNICNLKCVFCAYGKVETSRHVMSRELFMKTAAQAAAAGFADVGLTPTVGEVFVDKGFAHKLDCLDALEPIRTYHFVTNLTLPGRADIEDLVRRPKLSFVSVSVYGSDRDSFHTISTGAPALWDKVMENLELLYECAPEGLLVKIGVRTEAGVEFEGLDPRLQAVVEKFRARKGPFRFSLITGYNNWGGLVSQQEMQGVLDIKVGKPKRIDAPCRFLLHKSKVNVDGGVQACGCRDPRNILAIGDVAGTPLPQVFSAANARYMNIIKSFFRGTPPASCVQCDLYTSIFDPRPYKEDYELVSLEEHLRMLGQGR